jgi:hypothetical protein
MQILLPRYQAAINGFCMKTLPCVREAPIGARKWVPHADFNRQSEANVKYVSKLFILLLVLPGSILAAQEFIGRVTDSSDAVTRT